MADGDINTEQPAPPQTFDELVEQTSTEQANATLRASIDQFGLARARQLNGTELNPMQLIINLELQQEKLAAIVDELILLHGLNDKRLMLRLAGRMQVLTQKAKSPIIAAAVNRGMKPR